MLATDWWGNGGDIEIIEAGDAPSGNAYAKLKNRQASWSSIAQNIPITREHIGQILSTSFYFKLDDNMVFDGVDWVPRKVKILFVSQLFFNKEFFFSIFQIFLNNKKNSY